MRVFLDTNVLVSAFSTRGICADVVRAVLVEHQLVIGEAVLDELTRVLSHKMKVPTPIVAEIEALLRREAVVISEATPRNLGLRDRDDETVVAEALEGLATVLVTGDRDVLDAADQIPVDVVSPRGFWERLKGRD